MSVFFVIQEMPKDCPWKYQLCFMNFALLHNQNRKRGEIQKRCSFFYNLRESSHLFPMLNSAEQIYFPDLDYSDEIFEDKSQRSNNIKQCW